MSEQFPALSPVVYRSTGVGRDGIDRSLSFGLAAYARRGWSRQDFSLLYGRSRCFVYTEVFLLCSVADIPPRSPDIPSKQV